METARKVPLLTRIAVVEDEPDISRVIRDVLRESGYDVVSYFNPSADILDHIRELNPDIVIVDARLNCSITGWDIIEALKQDPATSTIRIIVCSGALDQIKSHQPLLEGYGIPVLPKPFDIEDLETLVGRVLVGEPAAGN
jgi:CheY-like chemotaxis protein